MTQLECITCGAQTGQFLEAEFADHLPDLALFIIEHADHTIVCHTPDGTFPVMG